MTENKSDLISREALKESMNKEAFNLSNGGMIFIENINRIIDNAPTVESDIEVATKDAYMQGYTDGWKERFGEPNERPQGEWITFPTNHSIIQCPECTALLNNLRADVFKGKVGNMNFCPNCGTKMGGST